jgi:hypothetical protein
MKYWINAVGYSIPQLVRTLRSNRFKGNRLYSQWYGRYALNKGLFKAIKLVWQNGK